LGPQRVQSAFAVLGQPAIDRGPGHPQPCGDVFGMGALLNLADRADPQLLQGLVIQLAAVVIAHARTRPDPHHKVNLLVNGLVTRAYRCATRRFPRPRSTVDGKVTKENESSWIFEPRLTCSNALRRVQNPGFSLVSALLTFS